MAIRAISDGHGGVSYIDTDTGEQLTGDQVDQRPKGFIDGIEKWTSGKVQQAEDWLNQTPQQRGTDPTQLANLYLANSTNNTDADTAARLNEAGNILGMNDTQKAVITQSGLNDPEILRAAEERVKQAQTAPIDWEQFAQDNPATAKYLSDRQNMAQSYDDAGPLAKIEQVWTSVKDHAKMADLEDQRAQMGYAMQQNGQTLNDLSPDQRATYEDIQIQLKDLSGKYGNAWDLTNVLGGVASMKTDLEEGLKVGAGGAIAGATAGLVGGPLGVISGGMAGLGYGFTSGMAFSMGKRAFGNAYLNALEQQSKTGDTMAPGSATWAAYISGAGNAFIGASGIGKLVSKLPAGAEVFSAFKKAVPDEVLTNPVAASAAWQVFAKNLATSTAEQSVIFGGLTKAVDIAAERTAEQMSGLSFDHSNEPTPVEQVLQSTVDFIPTALAMGGLAGLAKLPFDIQSQKRAELQKSIVDTAQAVSDSKTSTRSPDAVANLIHDISSDSPVNTLYIPADEAVKLFQTKMPDDENAMQAAMIKAGVDPKDLQEAMVTGGDIAIKSGDFFKTFSDAPYLNDLVKSVKTNPNDYTQSQLEQATQDYIGQLQAASDAVEGNGIKNDSPAYIQAIRIAKDFYPDGTSDKAIEKHANLIYAMAKQAESKGIFQALGMSGAEDGLKAITSKNINEPTSDPLLLQYAGEKSNSADRLELKKAQELSSNGIDNEAIRKQTGWFKGMDGKWRYEIDDSKAKFHEFDSIAEDLPKVLEHPSLYKAYPELNDIRVIKAPLDEDVQGAYDRTSNEIVLNEKLSPAEKKETLLHEIQHAIQNKENFASGGSPDTAISESRTLGEEGYARLAGEIEARDSSDRGNLSADNRREIPPNLRSDAIILHNGEEASYNIKKSADGPLAGYVPNGSGKATIEAYKNANMSSLPHEMMHHFVALYKEAEKSGNMRPDAISEFNSMKKFAGVEGDSWSIENEEKVARAFEQYLREGKAPSLDLVDAFNRFKSWLKNIYKKLKSDGFEINDDIRHLFDRMIASDDQIKQAELFYSAERLTGGREVGLGSVKDYVNILKKAHVEAESKLMKKYMEDMQPEFQKRVSDFEKKALSETSDSMRKTEPLYMALEAMRYSKDLPEENPGKAIVDSDKAPLKLNRKLVEEQYGKGAVPNDIMSKSGKYDLDTIAEMYGFDSGDALRQAIANNKPFGEELKRRVAQKVVDYKHQEIGNMKDEAIKSIHNQYNLEAIGVEAEAIRKAMTDKADQNKQKLADDWQNAKDQHKQDVKHEGEIQNLKDKYTSKIAIQDLNHAGEIQDIEDSAKYKFEKAKSVADSKLTEANQKIADAKVTKRWEQAVRNGRLKAAAARDAATKMIESKPIGDSFNWKKYVAQSVKAGKESSRALAKGDFAEALRLKDQELLNHALAMAASKAEKEINSSLAYFNKFNKRGMNMKNVPFEFNHQIDNLLDKYNLLTREPLKSLDGKPDLGLREFVDDCKESYFTPQVPDSIIDAPPTHYTRININELRDLKAAIKSIHHVGKIMDRALSDERKETMAERKDQIIGQLGEHVQRYKKDNAYGTPDLKLIELLGRIPDKFNTSLVKMESFCNVIDKGEHGPMTKYVLDPIYRAIGDYKVREEKAMEQFNNLVKEAGFTPKELAKMQKEKLHFDFLPNDLTKAEIVQMALNCGNEGNRDRLRPRFLTDNQKGRKLEDYEVAGVDQKIAQVIGSLDEKHWNLIQGIWNYLETYAPEVREHELSLTGVDPKMVEAKAFHVSTKDGKELDLAGGYYPIGYDPNKSGKAARRQEELSALYASNPGAQAMTRHGFTESRVQSYDSILNLDWSVLANHLKNVNYDLALRKAVIDVNRILNDKNVEGAVANVLGTKTHSEMLNWLRYVASDQSETMRGGEMLSRTLRKNTTKAALGFRLKAMFEDLPVNVLQSMWQMGEGDTLKGMSEFYTGNWVEQKAFVDDKSPMMRERLSFLDRDIAEFSKTMFEGNGLTAKAEKFIYFMDSMADAAITYPMWQKMYSKAVEKGVSEADAIQEADGFVRRATIDGSRAGLVNIQRGTEYSKLATMFYTWYSGLFNRFWTSAKTAQYQWADGEKIAAANTMLRAGLYGWVLPGIIAGTVKAAFANNQNNKKDQDKQNFASGFATQPLGMMPVIGNLASYEVNKTLGVYDSFNASPVESTLEKIVDAGPAVYNYFNPKSTAKPDGTKAIMAVADAASYGAFQKLGIGAYPNKVNTWAYNFFQYLEGHGDAAVSDFISRRHKNK